MIENLSNLDVTKKGGTTTSLKDTPLPEFLPQTKGKTNAENYRVRYQNLCVNELGDIAELEKIETKALQGKDVYVLDKKNYVFMDKMWILISYIEKVD